MLRVMCCLCVCPRGRGVFGNLSHVVRTVVAVIGNNKGYRGQWVGVVVMEMVVCGQ